MKTNLMRSQKAEGRGQKTGSTLPTAYCLPPTASGFTLVEMLVVMGIIVLAITLAIPTIRFLTGSKSTQAAENTMAAVLARTRSDAIGLQQPEGVLFVLDQTTNRVTLLEVTQTVNSYDPPGVTYLDLVPDRDPLVLPPGVGAWTIKDTYVPSGTTVAFTDPFGVSSPNTSGYRYLGYNNDTSGGTYTGSTVTDKALIGGVILFDGQGNLLVTPYGFRLMNTSMTPAQPTALAQALINFNALPAPTPPPTLWPMSAAAGYTPTLYLRSQIGFVLFDKETFENQERLLSPTPSNLDGNPMPASTSNEGVLDPWLDVNTTPLLINRYNGTLTRAE